MNKEKLEVQEEMYEHSNVHLIEKVAACPVLIWRYLYTCMPRARISRIKT